MIGFHYSNRFSETAEKVGRVNIYVRRLAQQQSKDEIENLFVGLYGEAWDSDWVNQKLIH